MKSLRFWVYGIVLSVLFYLALWLPGQYVVPVLVYHSIAHAKTQRMYQNSVSPESFEKQIAFIKNHGYHVLTVSEYVDILRTGKKFPAKSAVITFDDGLLDNYTNAFPVLKKHGVPATIFVPSAFVGRIDSAIDMPRMNQEQLKEMSEQGITIGSHTAEHAYLPDFDLSTVRQEVRNSKAALEKYIGRPVEYLAYPTGGFSEAIKSIVRDAGYKAAFTTNRGYARLNQDLYELKRIRPNNTDSAFVLWIKLSGYYNLFRSTKNPY